MSKSKPMLISDHPRLDDAADALRRYEMTGRFMRDWQFISPAQQRKWRDKVRVVWIALHKGETA